MSCSCNTAALRIFVRNVANIQVPSASQQVTPRVLSGIRRPRTSTSIHLHTRSLHTTRTARSESTTTTTEDASEGAAPTTAEKPETPKLLFRKTHAPPPSDEWATKTPNLPKRADHRFTAFKNKPGRDIDDTPKEPKKKIRWRDLPEEERRELYAKAGKEMPDEAERQARRQERQAQKLKEALEGKGKVEDSGEGEFKKHNPSNPKREDWQHQKNALKEKFPEGWKPLKKLSPDALEGIRALHKQFPDEYNTQVLADKFQVSPEAIRRILKSKWRPDPEEEIERQERWFKRGAQIWQRYAELGVKPPKKWREQGIKPSRYWKEEDKEKTFKDRHIANVKLHRSLL